VCFLTKVLLKYPHFSTEFGTTPHQMIPRMMSIFWPLLKSLVVRSHIWSIRPKPNKL